MSYRFASFPPLTWYLECCILGSASMILSHPKSSWMRLSLASSRGGPRYMTWLVILSSWM